MKQHRQYTGAYYYGAHIQKHTMLIQLVAPLERAVTLSNRTALPQFEVHLREMAVADVVGPGEEPDARAINAAVFH